MSDDRTAWFRDAKFGLFVHWGLYAQAAGVWQGRRYHGIGEWLMHRARIHTDDYEALAGAFNPVRFDAREWVALAKAAGMKYLVITSKHHDGFAMFGSRASRYSIVDATPFGRDPLAELATACAEGGLKLGFYYSQWQDWHEPGGAGNTWQFPDSAARFDEYFETKCKPQVRELLTNYGPLGLIWFDTPGGMTREQSLELVELVHTLQPGCLVSSRVGNGVGDFEDLGDHELPAGPIDGPWEAIFTHNDSWGYVETDQNWRPTRELLGMLLKVNAKGGNFLLNVGPRADGTIPEASCAVLRELGWWLGRHAEALERCDRSPFPELGWGECTARPGALYLHVLTWPADRVLRVPALGAPVEAVSLLAAGTPLAWELAADGDLLVELPAVMPDALATTIKVTWHGALRIAPVRTLMPGLTNTLSAPEAEAGGGATHRKHSWMEEFGDWKHLHVVEGWTAPDDAATWRLRVPEPGAWRLTLSYSRAGEDGREGCLTVGDRTLWWEAQHTGTQPRHRFAHTIGVVRFDEPGEHTLRLAPSAAGDELCKLAAVTLEPFA